MPNLTERRHEQTRTEIADAAVRLFLERGFTETTMDDVAAAAGVSRRTAYRHFPSKDDLVFEQPRRWLGAFDREVATRGPRRDRARAVPPRPARRGRADPGERRQRARRVRRVPRHPVAPRRQRSPPGRLVRAARGAPHPEPPAGGRPVAPAGHRGRRPRRHHDDARRRVGDGPAGGRHRRPHDRRPGPARPDLAGLARRSRRVERRTPVAASAPTPGGLRARRDQRGQRLEQRHHVGRPGHPEPGPRRVRPRPARRDRAARATP